MRFAWILMAIFPVSVLAWEGYESETGNLIEIDDEEHVRAGKEIDAYDWTTGEYKTYEVESVIENSIEVYDYGEGEFKILEMGTR